MNDDQPPFTVSRGEDGTWSVEWDRDGKHLHILFDGDHVDVYAAQGGHEMSWEL